MKVRIVEIKSKKDKALFIIERLESFTVYVFSEPVQTLPLWCQMINFFLKRKKTDWREFQHPNYHNRFDTLEEAKEVAQRLIELYTPIYHYL